MTTTEGTKMKNGKQVIDQVALDCAREWVCENYPELDGEEFEKKLQEAASDIAEINARCDEVDAGLK